MIVRETLENLLRTFVCRFYYRIFWKIEAQETSSCIPTFPFQHLFMVFVDCSKIGFVALGKHKQL